jgi:cell division septal protein FtsQ
MARVALPQSKIKARRRRRRLVVASLVAGAFVVIVGLVVWLSHAQFMRITTVTVSGESTLNASDISNLVLANLTDSYLYLFPKNNIFLYPKFKTEADLTKQMPTIAKVSVNAKDFHTLNVVVTERARKALWCGDSVTSASACFWLDQDGTAYAAASDLSISLEATGSYQKYYGSLTGSAPERYITPDQFHALSALIDALAQNQTNNPVQSIEVTAAGDVHVTFADTFTLIFNLSSAGADVYQRFTLALTSDAFVAHTLGDFQYLDLRFGDKLYYKLKAAQ